MPSTTFARQLVGTGLAGVVSWLVDTGVLWTLDAHTAVPLPVAAAAGFSCGGVTNFCLNRAVFQGTGASATRQGLRYLALFLANLAVVSVAVPALTVALRHVDGLPAPVVLAKIALTVLLVPVNAAVYRQWVFRPAAVVVTPEAQDAS